MEPLAVVKDFDPLEDGRVRFFARGKLEAMHKLAFDGAPEAFHHVVVIAVATTAHATSLEQNASPVQRLAS